MIDKYDSFPNIVRFTLIPYNRWHQMYWFCVNTFGEASSSELDDDNWVWAVRSKENSYNENDIRLLFRTIEDFTLFKLSWETP